MLGDENLDGRRDGPPRVLGGPANVGMAERDVRPLRDLLRLDENAILGFLQVQWLSRVSPRSCLSYVTVR